MAVEILMSFLFPFQDHFQILKLRRDTVPVVSKYCENPMVIICQKAVSNSKKMSLWSVLMEHLGHR